MITKENFVDIINSMQEQYAYDLAYSYGLSELIKTDDVCAYNNSLLCKSLIKTLRYWFPRNEEYDFCEIDHYCYVINFGKLGDKYESPEELYDRLCKIKNDLVVDDLQKIQNLITNNTNPIVFNSKPVIDDLKPIKDEFWQRSVT